MKRIVLATIGVLCLAFGAFSQNVFDPNDPIVNYNASAPPATPAMNVITKWVRTSRMSWNTTRFKSYYYNDMAFRMRFPNGYNPNDKTKKYPVIIFFHGGGEIAPVYDNEFHLLWGAQMFEQMINDGKFNAFLIFPQQKTIGWEETYFSRVNDILDTLAKYNNADPDRVIPMGLSIGGNGVLSYANLYPKRTATAIASSPSWVQLFVDSRQNFIHIPTWVGSGGQDTNPDPANVQKFVDSFAASGGDIRWTLSPTLGHVSWNEQWTQPYLAPYWNDAHKANPLIFFQKNQFCPDTIINVKLGITPGFYAYEWQKDNTTIATTVNGIDNIIDGSSLESYNANEITVNDFGTYRVRFMRTATSEWSSFSTKPAVISPKPFTTTPAITITGVKSKVLPAPDGSSTVPLELPAGFTAYEWKEISSGNVVSTTRNFNAPPGQYQATVKEQNICNSVPSPIFTVVDANGDPKPQLVDDLLATRLSATSIRLNWTTDPDSASYEVYRSVTAGGPYSLVAITAAGTATFTNTGLASNAAYYFVLRPVNESGAADLSNEATVPAVDAVAPTGPANLKAINTGTTFIELAWDNATDNVGVTGYDVFISGVKKYSTTTNSIIADNLTSNTTYSFTVKALDAAGNVSPVSNTLSAKTLPTVDATAPSVPLNLKALNIGTTSINLDWDNATDNVAVTGYDIYVNGVKKYTSTTSNVLANNLVANTTYSFTVKAFDLAGNNSGFSAALSTKTLAIAPPPDVTAPGTPANLKLVTAGTTTIELDWDNATDNVGVTGYDIYVNGVKKYSSTTSTIIANNLTPNTTYSFTVKAFDFAGNNSAFSAALSVKTLALPDFSAPTAPANLKVISIASTTVQLDWDNATDNVGVTGYDVYVNGLKKYSATTSNIVANNLTPNTTYSFTVKAIDAAGNNSAASNAVTAKTSGAGDVIAPTAPSALKVIYTTRTSVELGWTKSTDNVGVTRYDIFVNGVKKYSTTATTFTATGLTTLTSYKFTVKAADLAGNISAASNQVTAVPMLIGLKYSYYEGTWSSLPNFNSLTPVKTGVTEKITLDDRRTGVNDNFGFVWEGFIKITKPGVYTFETRSDDGSKFYFNTNYQAALTAQVNNDGLHEEKSVTSNVYIAAAGVYPIAVTFFERTGEGKMALYWKGPGISRQLVPMSAFSDVTTGASSYLDALMSYFNGSYFQNSNGGVAAENLGAVEENRTDVIAQAATAEITKAFPSPFIDVVNVEFTNKSNDSKVSVNIFDVYGKLVHRQDFGSVPGGKARLSINLNDRQLPTGYYMLRLVVDGKSSKPIKLVKTGK